MPKIGDPIEGQFDNTGTQLLYNEADIANLSSEENKPATSPVLSISTNQGETAKLQADKTMADLTKPIIDKGNVATASKIYVNGQLVDNPALAKPEEKPVEITEIGTDASGNKLYYNSQTGETKTATDLTTPKSDIQKQSDLGLAQAQKVLTDLTSQLSGYMINDADLQNQTSAITSKWDAKIRQMEDINFRRKEAVETLGVRMGSRWTGGAGGVFGGIISEEERQGVLRVGELESQKQEAIAAAKSAAKKQNWETYVKAVDLASNAVEKKQKTVQELNQLALDSQKAITEWAKEQRVQIQSDLDNSDKIIKSLGYLTVNSLTGNEAQDNETIKTIAAQYRIDPNMLKNEAQRLQQEKIKYPSGDEGNFLFAQDSALQAGIKPEDLPEHLKNFDAWLTYDANRKAKASGGTGLDQKQTQNFLTISNKYQADEIIKNGDKAISTIAIANQVIAHPEKATNQLKALYALVKSLDPDSAVREGELALAQQAQSYIGRFKTNLQKIAEGKLISSSTAKELAEATKELAITWQDAAKARTKRYSSQANIAGIGDAFSQYLSGSEFNQESNTDEQELLDAGYTQEQIDEIKNAQ